MEVLVKNFFILKKDGTPFFVRDQKENNVNIENDLILRTTITQSLKNSTNNHTIIPYHEIDHFVIAHKNYIIIIGFRINGSLRPYFKIAFDHFRKDNPTQTINSFEEMTLNDLSVFANNSIEKFIEYLNESMKENMQLHVMYQLNQGRVIV